MAAKKYIPSKAHLNAVEQMSSKGVPYAKMAKALKISLSTFRNNLHLFESHIKKGCDTVDEEAVQHEIDSVKNALLKRCLGHEYEEKTIEKKRNSDNVPFTTHQKVVKKMVQPSDSAIFFYLVNKTNGEFVSINHSTEERAGTGGNVDDRFKEIAAALRESYTETSPIPEG